MGMYIIWFATSTSTKQPIISGNPAMFEPKEENLEIRKVKAATRRSIWKV